MAPACPTVFHAGILFQATEDVVMVLADILLFELANVGALSISCPLIDTDVDPELVSSTVNWMLALVIVVLYSIPSSR